MINTEGIIRQLSPYGLVIKIKRRDIALIFVVTFLLCVAISPHWSHDFELREASKEPTAEVSQITNSAEIIITATGAYTPPSE